MGDDLADIPAGSSLRGPGVYMTASNPRFWSVTALFLTAFGSFGLAVLLLLAPPGIPEHVADLPGETAVPLEAFEELRVYKEWETAAPAHGNLTFEILDPEGRALPLEPAGLIEMGGGSHPGTLRSLEWVVMPTDTATHRVVGRDPEGSGERLRLVLIPSGFGALGPIAGVLFLVFGVCFAAAMVLLFRHGTPGVR